MRYRKLLTICMLSLCLTACGKKTQQDLPQDTISVQQDVSVSGNETQKVPDIETITREEFRNLTPNDIKLIAEHYIGDYRAVYGISEDHVMTQSDWAMIGSLMEYQIFGKLSEDESLYKKEQIEREKNRVIASVSGNEATYLLMDTDYILSLSDEEFLTWFKEAGEYYGTYISDEELATFDTPQKIEKLRQSLINNLKEAEN